MLSSLMADILTLLS